MPLSLAPLSDIDPALLDDAGRGGMGEDPAAPDDAMGAGPADAEEELDPSQTQRLDHPTPADLWTRVENNYEALRVHREERLGNITEYQGAHHANGDGIQRPLNPIAMAVDTLIPHLVPKDPKHKVSPRGRRELRSEANLLSMGIDHTARELHLKEKYRECLRDSLLGPMGIIKFGETDSSRTVMMDDQEVNLGELYGDVIDFDDFVIEGKTIRQRTMEGHKYRIDRDWAAASNIYGREPGEPGWTKECMNRKEAADYLRELPDLEAQQDGQPKAEDVNDTWRGGVREDRRGLIELWDIVCYRPDGAWVYTIAHGASHPDRYLVCRAYNGPEGGEYKYLYYRTLPNGLIPKCPASDWRDLHDALRKVTAKIVSDILNYRRIGVYDLASADDGMTIQRARHQEMVGVQNAQAVHEMVLGGPNPDSFQYVKFLLEMWNNMTGNLLLLGGGGAEGGGKAASTATEATYLQNNAGVRIADMRDVLMGFATQCGEYIGWWLTYDPNVDLPLTYNARGVQVPLDFTAADREGDFLDYTYEIVPQSFRAVDPNVRLQKLVEIIQLLPALIQVASTGIIDLKATMRMMASEFDLPELEEIVNDPERAMEIAMKMAGITQPSKGGMAPGGMPMQEQGMEGQGMEGQQMPPQTSGGLPKAGPGGMPPQQQPMGGGGGGGGRPTPGRRPQGGPPAKSKQGRSPIASTRSALAPTVPGQ